MRESEQEGHVPLTCEEADRDARLDGVHAVEGEPPSFSSSFPHIADRARSN